MYGKLPDVPSTPALLVVRRDAAATRAGLRDCYTAEHDVPQAVELSWAEPDQR
jgi:hypothetical protein